MDPREAVVPGGMVLIFGLASLSMFSSAATDTGLGVALKILGGFVALMLALAVVALWVTTEFWTRL